MTDRTSSYADAIVALATAEGALDAVETELLTVARAIDDNEGLRDRLTDIQMPVSQRLKFIESDVLTAAHPATRGALAMVISAGRAGDITSIATAVAEAAAEQRDSELAEVSVAVELDERQREQLKAALERATGKKLELKFHVDPSVMGGVRAKIGDTVIDGTVAKRLDDIRTKIAG